MSSLDRLQQALNWTTEEVVAGRGQGQLRASSSYLKDIQKHFGHLIDGGAVPRLVLPAEFLVVDDDGGRDSVVSVRPGLLLVFSDAYVVARDLSRYKTWTYLLRGRGPIDVTEVTLEGRIEPGLQISADDGRLELLIPDRHVGTPAQRLAIRNRMAALLSGEQQAGPGTRDVPSGYQRGLVQLISFPGEPIDIMSPQLDENARPVMDDGETALHHGQYFVRGVRQETDASGTRWRPVEAPTAKAKVWFTTARVVVIWPNISTESLRRRRAEAGYAPSQGENLATACHLRGPWLNAIFLNAPALNSPSLLSLQVNDAGPQMRLQVEGIANETLAILIYDFGAAIAQSRLDADDTLTAVEIDQLRQIAARRTALTELSWGAQLALPSAYKIGRDPASRQ